MASLATPPNLAQPQTKYVAPELIQAPLVARNGMVLEVPPHHRLQPFGRLRQRIMQPLSQLGMYLL
jgi:hypothetical protein